MRLDHLTGDKAYSSRANRQALRARRIPHTTPERDDQKANRARKGTPGGRPPRFDRQRYKRRNQVERSVNRLKGWRRVATRYDKLACRYQATVTIADIFIWLRAKPDQPRGDPGTHALELIGYDPQTGIFPSTDVLRLLADAAAVPVRRPQRPRDITAAYAPQIQPFFTCPRFVYGRFASARRDGEADAMLLGRRTYDEFATWWPSQGDSTPIARLTNAIPKLVVTSDPSGLTWGPVAALGSDPVAAACRATTDVRP